GSPAPAGGGAGRGRARSKGRPPRRGGGESVAPAARAAAPRRREPLVRPPARRGDRQGAGHHRQQRPAAALPGPGDPPGKTHFQGGAPAMNPPDPHDEVVLTPEEQALAEALHKALEPPGAATGPDPLKGLLEVAGLLDEFSSHVARTSGVHSAPRRGPDPDEELERSKLERRRRQMEAALRKRAAEDWP